METEALEGLGLTRNESIVYVTLLEMGSSHIGQLAEKTRMHRRTIYDCIERLQDRGLVSAVLEGKTRFFTAVNPQKLKEMMKERQEKIENLLPKLLEISKKSKQKTEVSVNKGKEGLKTIMEDLLKTRPKVWYSLSYAGMGIDVLPYYIPNFQERRAKEKILLKVIFEKNEPAIKRAKELKKLKMTEIRFIDTEKLIPLSFWVYENKVVIILWESEIGISIENIETAEAFRDYFSILWNTGKKF